MTIKRTAALLAAAGIAALAATGATVAAAASSAPSDTEHWIAESTNPVSATATLTSSGTYKITGGTGLYRHVAGNGSYSLVAYAIVKKVKGKCSVSVPYAQTELLTATGPLTG